METTTRAQRNVSCRCGYHGKKKKSSLVGGGSGTHRVIPRHLGRADGMSRVLSPNGGRAKASQETRLPFYRSSYNFNHARPCR